MKLKLFLKFKDWCFFCLNVQQVRTGLVLLERRRAMTLSSLYLLPLAVILVFVLLMASVKILREYERAVVFTLGRFQRVKVQAWCS